MTHRPVAGFALLLMLLWPPVRHATEASMAAHMLVQYTGLLVAGALLAEPLVQPGGRGLQRWNELGIAGLAGSALTLAVLMVPRLLDLALTDWRVESLKLLALVLTGAALRLSWQRAGTVVQAFFLGNVLPMTVVVGTLYQDSPTRVCNAYLLDDQRLLGVGLVWAALGVVAAWMLRLGWVRRGTQASPADAPAQPSRARKIQ